MTDIATAYVRLRPNSANFQKEAESQVAGALHGIKKSVGAAIGGLGVYEILKSTFEAAAKEQSAVASIELAVKNARSEWEVYGKTVDEVLAEQEHRTGFDLPEQAQAFGRLIQQTKDTKLALADLNIAMDVSRGRHLGLAQVATALARLEGGNAQSLSRLGIITDRYTGQQDALKAQIRDVAVALSAQASSHQKTYDGQLKVTASQAALLSQGKSVLLQREADLKSQLAAAAASDKQTTTEQARAELLRRYSGQADAFAKTAAGQLAVLHTSIEQVQEAIGGAFLPLLTAGAKDLSEWAYQLSNSDAFARQLATGARDVGDALHAVGDGIHAIAPLVSTLQQIVDVVGTGPILAFVAAWKLLPPVLALAGTEEAALSADTVALQTSLAGVETQLDAFAAQVAAVGTAEAATTLATEGLTASQIELMAAMDANIAETEALLAVEGEASVASAGLGVGLSGLLGPLALLAGGLYYVHQHFDQADDSGKRFTETIGKVQDAARLAATDVAGGRISTDQAKQALDAATLQHQAAVEAVASDSATSVSAERLSADQTALRDTTLSLRSATHAYALASADLHKREVDRAKGSADLKAQVSSLTTQIVDLGKRSNEVAGFLASHGKTSWIKELPQHSLELFLRALDNLAKQNPTMSAAIENLKGIAKAAGAIPDRVTIALTLNPTLDPTELTNQIVGQIRSAQEAAQAALTGGPGGLLGRGGLAPLPSKTGADFAADFTKAGGRYPAELKVKVKPDPVKAAATYSQAFVQTIDASGIRQSLIDAIGSARSGIESQASSLATAVGNVLDARLAATEKTLDATAKVIQDRINARSQAATARSATQGAGDAALKLKELQDVLGGGALTAEQQVQLQAAKNAVLDSQDAIANATDQTSIDALAARKTALEQQAALEKTASSQRIADLGAELNRGLITQAAYVKGVRGILDKEKVNYKDSGKLLGVAFADGFRDALKGVIDQAQALGLVGRTTLRGQPTSTTAVNPLKEQAKATQSVIDQIAGSGGHFKLTGTGALPPGVTVASLLAAAGAQRGESAYRQKSSVQADQTIHYVGLTADHTKAILDELKAANKKPPVVVVDDHKKKAKIAQATR